MVGAVVVGVVGVVGVAVLMPVSPLTASTAADPVAMLPAEPAPIIAPRPVAAAT